MKKLFTLVFLFSVVNGFGQFMETLDANNVGAKIPVGGNFFWDYDRASFICPKSYSPDGNLFGTASLFMSSLWLSAFDAANNLKLAAVTYETRNISNFLEERGTDFFDGPISNNYDSEFDSLYRTVWKVSKSEIEYHQQHYADVGYVMPISIANWRGYGRTDYGESQILAPFQDINGNGIYEPQLGDYPLIRGDQAIFKILNDDRHIHAFSGGQKLGIELKMMFYEYTASDVVNNTVFLHIEIANKSGGLLNDLKLSNFVDIDLGCGYNDGVGCDSSLNLFFGYNATQNDAVFCALGTMSYLSTPVGVAVLSLCDDLVGFKRYTGYHYQDTLNSLPVGYDRTTFRYCNHYNSIQTDSLLLYSNPLYVDTVNNVLHISSQLLYYCDTLGFLHLVDTLSSIQYRNAQECLLSNGTPIIDNNGSTTCFMFYGDVADSTQWNSYTPMDYLGYGEVTGTYSLGNLPNESRTAFDMAYFVAIDSTQTTNNFSVTNLMKHQSQTVKSHFLSNAPCHEIMSIAYGGSGINDVGLLLGISPNPSNGVFSLTSDIQQGGVIGVYTITGAKVFTSKVSSLNRTTIDISQQPKGIYIVKVNNSRGVWTQRVVVE